MRAGSHSGLIRLIVLWPFFDHRFWSVWDSGFSSGQKKNGGGASLGRSPAALRASIGGGLRGSPETRPTEALKGSVWTPHLEGSKGVLLDTPEGARRGVTWVLQSSRIGGLYDLSSNSCRGSVWSL